LKRITSTFLVVCTLFACMTQTFAAQVQSENNEIQLRFQSEMQMVYEQLEMQDALDMIDIYEEIIYNKIVADIRGQSNDLIMPLEDTTSYYAPNGGSISYTKNREAGVSPVQVIITAMGPTASNEFILAHTNDPYLIFTLSGVLATFIGIMPKFTIPAVAVSTILAWQGFVTQTTIKSIRNNGGQVHITQTYSAVDGSVVTVITGWSSPTLYGPYGSVSNVQFTKF